MSSFSCGVPRSQAELMVRYEVGMSNQRKEVFEKELSKNFRSNGCRCRFRFTVILGTRETNENSGNIFSNGVRPKRVFFQYINRGFLYGADIHLQIHIECCICNRIVAADGEEE
jgi:hypothetical protein